MFSRFHFIICAVLFAALILPGAALSADVTPTPVALYANSPDVVVKEGKRAAKILGDQKITHWPGDRIFDQAFWAKWVIDHQTGSAVVLFVPRDNSSQARLLLARVIKAEGQRITLLGDDAKSVTAESILERGKKP